VCKQVSFDNIPRWLRELRDHANRDIVLLLVGNKRDLAENGGVRQVSTEIAQAFADQNHFQFIETSAMSGANVDEAFVSIIKSIYDQAFSAKAQVLQAKNVAAAIQGSAGPGTVQLGNGNGRSRNGSSSKERACCG